MKSIQFAQGIFPTILIALALTLAGCGSGPQAQKGTAVGAAAGGVLGAVVGDGVGDAAVGAAAGAAAGNAYGDAQDEQRGTAENL